jgi:hypothetical protein
MRDELLRRIVAPQKKFSKKNSQRKKAGRFAGLCLNKRWSAESGD